MHTFAEAARIRRLLAAVVDAKVPRLLVWTVSLKCRYGDGPYPTALENVHGTHQYKNSFLKISEIINDGELGYNA